MDEVLCYGLILLSLLLICLLHTLLSHKTNQCTPPLPPGNLGLPLVGESIEFLTLLKSGISEKFIFHRMIQYSRDVFKTSLIAEPTAVVCGSAGSKFLFNNDNKLVRQWWPLGLNSLLGQSRKSPFPLKDIVLEFSRVHELKNHVPIMDRLAKRHLETKWRGRQEVIVLPLVKNFTFSVGCNLVLSMEDEESMQKLQTLITTIIGGFLKPAINFPGSAYSRALKAWSVTRKQLAEIVQARRRTMEFMETATNANCSVFQDTLSSLLAAIHDSREIMSDVEIADRLIGLLVTIHDTTHIVISMIFKYLGKHPDVYDAILKENMEVAAKKRVGEVYLKWEDVQKLKYTWNVTREVLRLCPPAQGLLREALVDFTYAGFHIPKGWKLLLSIKAIHMDPKYFGEPDKFDPSRFEGEGPLPNTYMPFGGGLNMCPGKNFAQALVLVFVHNVVTRFQWKLKLESDDKINVDPIPRPASGIPIYLYAHSS